MYSESAVDLCLLGPNEVVAEIAALIGRVGFRQWAHAGPSRRDAVALTLPESLQVRYLSPTSPAQAEIPFFGKYFRFELGL